MTVQPESGKGIKTDSQTAVTAPAGPAQPAAGQPPAQQVEPAPAEVAQVLQGAIATPAGEADPAGNPAAPEGGENAGNPPEGDAPPPEYTFDIPEGFQVNEESMGAFKALAGKYKLPPEAAKELFDVYTKEAGGARDAFQKQYTEALVAEHTEGLNQIKADPEFGGEKYPESQRCVGLALRKYGDDDFVAGIKRRVMANDPGLFRFLARVGKSLNEPGPVASNAFAAAQSKSRAEALFPDYNP